MNDTVIDVQVGTASTMNTVSSIHTTGVDGNGSSNSCTFKLHLNLNSRVLPKISACCVSMFTDNLNINTDAKHNATYST